MKHRPVVNTCRDAPPPEYGPRLEHEHLAARIARERLDASRDGLLARIRALLRMPAYGHQDVTRVEHWRVTRPQGEIVRHDVVDRSTGVVVPCMLGLPRSVPAPPPLMVCLQGHTNGMHVSMGISAMDPTVDEPAAGDRDIARQCMANGIAALCIEQRGFGLRRDNTENRVDCTLMAMRALALGRTLVGERVADVRLALDALAEDDTPEVDIERLGIVGNSAGGTTAMYASVLDERFKLLVASCSFAPLATSWLSRPHCVCGYVPDMFRVTDLPEMLALRVPAPVVVVGAAGDYHVAESDLREAFSRLKAAYVAARAADSCRLEVGPGGHRFYAGLTWPHILDLL